MLGGRGKKKKEKEIPPKNSSRFHHLSLQRLSAPSVVPAHINCSHIRAQSRAPPWLHSPQNVVDPDDVAFVGGFVVNGDGGSGLDPQVAPPPLEPAVIAGHHLTFPQHWGEDGRGSETQRQRTRGRMRESCWLATSSAEGANDRPRRDLHLSELSDWVQSRKHDLMRVTFMLALTHGPRGSAGDSPGLPRGWSGSRCVRPPLPGSGPCTLRSCRDTNTRSRGSRQKRWTQVFKRGPFLWQCLLMLMCL